MLVEFIRVAKSYGAVEVLTNVNFQLAAGAAVAIVGPSGSGKSTLLNLLGALDQPTRGAVRFAGRDLSHLAENELAGIRNRQIGFVFQLHHLLPQCSVLENVLVPTLTMPANSTNRDRAVHLLERVGLQHRLEHRPGQLSGGECQRVAVARALINRPQLLLADEPTGSLDHGNANSLGRLLLDLNREEGVALVVVTHSLELARQMPRVLELRDGELN
ncbi:MAG: ABC transporter ATP-binding protein [Verrucomicrobiota bacterium]